jgi:hypothetical protein
MGALRRHAATMALEGGVEVSLTNAGRPVGTLAEDGDGDARAAGAAASGSGAARKAAPRQRRPSGGRSLGAAAN